MIKIMIVDDHHAVLEGTKNLFNDVDDIIVDASDNVYEIHKMINENRSFYDVYLVDINMPEQNGIVLCSKIRTYQPTAKVILYTGDNIEDYYSLLLDKLVHGVLSKTATKEQVIHTIRETLKDSLVIPANFIDFVKNHYNDGDNEDTLKLNDREQQLLQYVSMGYSNSVIAKELQVSQRTIERNLSQLFNLLNVTSRSEAVMVAKERNLF
ncbi:response regulator transcription factor [Ureibacillus acetophenoni]|uniref:LuxR family two component transcriptional regulator n=1 Tax=Ureibacillus acetophenoni TaxID=614649 RepID=A0A285U854_9BACL|nr:response regulator transcription factor [Ureibacillus acetophenoni]SOC36471.1 LuxR family two component transcriptional regulator [Ureibacillus acetophenoni]